MDRNSPQKVRLLDIYNQAGLPVKTKVDEITRISSKWCKKNFLTVCKQICMLKRISRIDKLHCLSVNGTLHFFKRACSGGV